MNQRKLSRYLLWMALIATLVSAYEFCTRVDAMWKPLKMFWNMAVGEKIPLARAATYVDMSIFEIPLYLLCSVALGIWALWARRTRRGCALLIAPSAVLAALGFILPLLWKEFRSRRAMCLTGFLMSLGIELAQLLNYRISDVDDLIMNTLGAFLGYALLMLLSRKKKELLIQEQADGRKMFLAILGVVILVMFALRPYITRAVSNIMF